MGNNEDKPKAFEPAYRTHAILDEEEKTPDAKVTLPTKRGVTEARRFVEENQK